MKTSPTATYDVLLVSQRGLGKELGANIVKIFDRFPGPVSVRLHSKQLELKATADGTLGWEEIFSILGRLRSEENVPEKGFLHLLTVTPNERNWYAAEDETQMRNSFGHVGDFKWVTSAPNEAIAAHYILKAIYNCLLVEAGVDWFSLWHGTPRGCFFDFCRVKEQLNLKLRTADICGDCMNALQSIGVPDALLKQTALIMESIRRQALNARLVRSEENSFDHWPFPVAVTRHKAVQATNPLLRFLLLIDHFDSLIRYFYLSHEILQGRIPEVTDRPSLGWWVDKLASSLKNEKSFRDVVRIAQKENVVSIRNEMRGHGYMRPHAEEYRGDAEHLQTVIDEIEEELRPFLDKYQLVIPRQFELRAGKYIIEGELLQGSHLLHPVFSETTDADPRSVGISNIGEVYLTDARRTEYKTMFPSIQHGICPECHHPRVLITDGGAQYIDAFMGHRVDLPKRLA